MKRRDTGILGEKLAQDFLRKQGYLILETNYRCAEGEVDIIANHGEFLVFIEVRTKKAFSRVVPKNQLHPRRWKS